MNLHQTAASRFGVGLAVLSVMAIAFLAGSHFHEERLAAQGAPGTTPARLPVVDEYYPVKHDAIATDRSILTIKHQPTGSCYILLYPAGDALMPVEKERCAPPPAER